MAPRPTSIAGWREPEPRLKSGLWVRALVRAGASLGLAVTISRKGDEDAGAVLLKQNFLGEGFRVLTQIRTGDGQPAWMPGTGSELVDEAAADSFIAREIQRDFDVWVIEIEDREGRLPLGGTVVL